MSDYVTQVKETNRLVSKLPRVSISVGVSFLKKSIYLFFVVVFFFLYFFRRKRPKTNSKSVSFSSIIFKH